LVREVAKCSCCNKRLKRVVTYECHTLDCEDFEINGEFSEETYPKLKYRWHKTYKDYLKEMSGQ